MTAFASLGRAMLKGYLRDRMAVFFSIVFPLMFLVLFGGLLTGDGASQARVLQVGDVPALTSAPQQMRDALADSLDFVKVKDRAAALEEVRKGDADGLVEQNGSKVVVHFSAADPVNSAEVRGQLEALIQAANLVESGQPPAYLLTSEQVEDDSMTPIQFYTPGLMGWAIASGATFGAAANLVVWRKNGLLRRLRLAPIRTSSVVLARVAVSLVVALIQAAIFLGVGVGFFGLELSGAWPLIVPLIVAGTLAFMAIGLLAGAVAKSEEAAIGIANFVVLPMAFLSGSFFPLDDAPGWIHTIGHVLPLKHLNDGMLDVMVRGEGLGSTLLPLAVLLAFAAGVSLIASLLFRWDD